MNKFEMFDKAHDEAKECIRRHMSSKHTDVRTLVSWLMETNANPYEIFYSHKDASLMANSTGMASLARSIAHAVVDDGDICYVVFDKQYACIAFQHEAEFEIDEDAHISSKPPKSITFCDDADSFIRTFNALRAKHVRKCFELDASRMGLGTALRLYYNKDEYADILTDDWFNTNLDFIDNDV